MITRLRIRPAAGGTWRTFSPGVRNASGEKLLAVEGLAPVKGTVSTTEYAYLDGVSLNRIKIGARNIVMAFDFDSETYGGASTSKRAFFNLLSVGEEFELEFTMLEGESYPFMIKGYVESNEGNLFTKTPVVQVSLVCPDPYFYGPTSVQEIANPALFTNVHNPGDLPAGVTMGIYPTGTAPQDIQTLSMQMYDGASTLVAEQTTNPPNYRSYFNGNYFRSVGGVVQGVEFCSAETNRYFVATTEEVENHKIERSLYNSLIVGTPNMPRVFRDWMIPPQSTRRFRFVANSGITLSDFSRARYAFTPRYRGLG